MPYVTRRLSREGAVVELLAGVNDARRDVLLRNGFPVPERVRVLAQVDTGAEITAVDVRVFRQLRLAPIDTALVRTTSPPNSPRPLSVTPSASPWTPRTKSSWCCPRWK